MIAVASERVDNAELRAQFELRRELGWLTAEQVALRLDWIKWDGYPDTTRVLRVLGLSCAGRQGNQQATVRYDMAVGLCHAIGCLPREVGL